MIKILSIEAPFPWIVFSIASALLSVIVIVLFNYRRQVPLFRNLLASISFLIITLFVFSLGPYFESCSWIILTNGITGLCFADIFHASFSINYLNNLVLMLFSASATMVVAYISKSFRHKLLYAWLTAFLTISFTDIILRSLKAVELSHLFFDLLSNIIGGLFLGLIVAYVSILVDNIFSKQYQKSIIISHFKYLTILLGALLFLSLGVYFLFIFQIDYNFLLTLNKWETIKFYYNSTDITLDNNEYAMILFKTESLYARNNGNKIDITWDLITNSDSNYHNEGKTKFAILHINKDVKYDIIYSRSIKSGNIELFGNNFNIRFTTINKNRSYNFFALIPKKNKIYITKDRNLLPFYSAINNPVIQQSSNPKNIVGLISEKGGIKAIFKGVESMTMYVMPDSLFNLSLKTDKKKVEFRLPGESKPIIVDNVKDNLFILGKKDGEKYIEINSNFDVIEFENSNYRLETYAGYSNPTKIGEFVVWLPRGTLSIGGKKVQLQDDYNLYLGGEDIEMKQNIGDEDISLNGRTNRIILNNIPYPLSYWSSLSNEIQNGVIAGTFMLFGTLLGFFLGKRNRK